jgi:hypothetical protein
MSGVNGLTARHKSRGTENLRRIGYRLLPHERNPVAEAAMLRLSGQTRISQADVQAVWPSRLPKYQRPFERPQPLERRTLNHPR